jgi:hypothetical protein
MIAKALHDGVGITENKMSDYVNLLLLGQHIETSAFVLTSSSIIIIVIIIIHILVKISATQQPTTKAEFATIYNSWTPFSNLLARDVQISAVLTINTWPHNADRFLSCANFTSSDGYDGSYTDCSLSILCSYII